MGIADAAYNAHKDRHRQSNALLDQGISQLQNIYSPTAGDLAGFDDVQTSDHPLSWYIDQYTQTNLGPDGKINPTIEARIQQQAMSEYQADLQRHQSDAMNSMATSQMQKDPLAQQAIQTSFGNLNQIANQGWTNTDRQALDAANRQASQYEQSQRQAVMQDARSRGMGGSGVEMLGALQAQQSGANRAADVANQTAIEGRNRSMQASGQLGQMGQEYGGNLDAYNQWYRNWRADATQQKFNNQMDQAGAVVGQGNVLAGYLNDQQKQRAQVIGQGAQAAGQAASTAIMYAAMA